MATDLTDPPPPTTTVPADPAAGADQANERFHRLHKMSTTAGVGAGDYVAINGAAIAAVLLGLATATVLFGNAFLLLIPLGAIVCAVLAWYEVGQSNGTQTGRGLAALGVLLALGLGGYEGVTLGAAAIHSAAARRQVVTLIRDFGQRIADEHYRDAYAMCDAGFQQQVSMPIFEGTWRSAHNSRVLGTLTGIDWNGQLAFDIDPTTGQQVGSGMVLVEFNHNGESARTDMFFRLSNGRWMIDRIPQVFAPPAAKPTLKPIGPRPPNSIPPMIGPPKPI